MAVIIECTECARKFSVREQASTPLGTAVKCSRCGSAFTAYPGGRTRPGEGAATERRRHPRVQVSIPALCSLSDPHGNPMDLAFITDIGHKGIALELFPQPTSEVISVSVVGLDRREFRINGRVAHARALANGKMRLGLALVGVQSEIRLFIAKAAETYRTRLMQTEAGAVPPIR